MVAVGLVTDRRVLFHHERPLLPTSKRAKVELRSCCKKPLDPVVSSDLRGMFELPNGRKIKRWL
jgi:hypothetical protein